MDTWKKWMLVFLSSVLLFIVGACAYTIKVSSEANRTVKEIYESLGERSEKRKSAVNIDAQEPFSVLLLGLDTGDLGRDEQGRSDTTMVVTINPKERKSTMVSLDRDLLVNIEGYGQDKLNHSYAYGGVKLAVGTVEDLLDIPIDYYVTINMQGLKDLIDAVGGIEVNNTLGEFSLDGILVPAGKIKLTGETGLAYARMRYEDPEGDVGRQKRQREVVEKIVYKVLSFEGVTKYRKILDAVTNNVKMNLTWDNMIDIQKKYLTAFRKIDSLQLAGKDTTINEVYYQILNADQLYEMQTTLRKQLKLPKNPPIETNEYAHAQDFMMEEDADKYNSYE